MKIRAEHLTDEELAGHLLCPSVGDLPLDELLELLEEIPYGSLFFRPDAAENLSKKTAAVQKASRHPVLIAADLEHGPNAIYDWGGEQFPWLMCAGAAGSADLMRDMAACTARVGRACGVHWTFSPVADLAFNWRNPVVNIRALGDSPSLNKRLLVEYVLRLQSDGMAATAKHFPGDGVDERDQHLCTTINSMPMDQWHATYGAVWKGLIEAGVMTIMAGHISLPDYQGPNDDPEQALPATLCNQLQIDLLRKEFGFEGVLISDAIPMIGASSRCPSDRVVVANLKAGCDVCLWGDPRKDYYRVLEAIRKGELGRQRVLGSVDRVLRLKERLGLASPGRDDRPALPVGAELDGFNASAQEVADRGCSWLRKPEESLLSGIPEGTRTLTVTLRNANPKRLPADLDAFDETLRRYGLDVTHKINPSHRELAEMIPQFDEIFINIYVNHHQVMGTTRMIGQVIFAFWRSCYADFPRIRFTSFGSPYVLNDQPHLPNLLATYSPEAVNQRAAARVWLGRIQAADKPHIHLEKITVTPVTHPGVPEHLRPEKGGFLAAAN